MVDVERMGADGRDWTPDEMHERWDRGYGVWNAAETVNGMKAIHCPGDAVGESGEVIFPAEFESVWWRVDVCSEPAFQDGSDHSPVGKLLEAAARPLRVWEPVNVFGGFDDPGVILTGDGRFVACPETAAWAVSRWSANGGLPAENRDDVLRVSGIAVFSEAYGDHSLRQHNGHLLDGEEDLDDIELFITMEDRYTVLVENGPRVLDCTWIAPQRSMEDNNWPAHPMDQVSHTAEEMAAMGWNVGTVQQIIGRDGQPLVQAARRRGMGMGL